jgi:integrating conjugative element protein (TIGR03746 family)
MGLFFVCGFLAWGWDRAKKITPLHIPPDIRTGAIVKPNDPQPEHIYAFALMIMQTLNHWPTDGTKDYGLAIYNVSPYLTPRYAEELKADLKHRVVNRIEGTGISVDELSGRQRAIQSILGHGFEDKRVILHGNGSWTVLLDLHINETVSGMNVKSIDVSYPVRIVAYDVNSNLNPWGLALDGYDAPGPTRIVAAPVNHQSSTTPASAGTH